MLHNAEQRRGTGTSAVQSHDLSPSISLIRKASIIMLALSITPKDTDRFRCFRDRLRYDRELYARQSASQENEARTPRAYTPRGGADAKIKGFLLMHHRYLQGKCEKYEYASVDEIEIGADVSRGSVTNFFRRHFGHGRAEGNRQYRRACASRTTLDAAMQLLAGDFRPRDLFRPLSGHEVRESDELMDE